MPVKRNWLWKSGTFPFTHICFCCFFSPKLEFYKNGKDQKRCLESLSLEIWLSFSIDCQFCNFKLVVFGGFLMAAQSLQYHLWILLSWFLLWDCWKLENHLCQILSFFSAKLFTFYDFDMRQTQFMQPGPREEEENSYGNNPIFFSSLVFLFFFWLDLKWVNESYSVVQGFGNKDNNLKNWQCCPFFYNYYPIFQGYGNKDNNCRKGSNIANSTIIILFFIISFYVWFWFFNWRDILMSRHAPNKEALPIANSQQSSIAPEISWQFS